MARYWFRQKRFGYGAAPATWQGWTLTVCALLLIAGIVLFAPAIRDNESRTLWVALGIAVVGVPSCVIAWFKTEGGWRWRSGQE